MTRRIGYDDPSVAADVEAAYDAELERELRRLASVEKWARRGRLFGVVLALLALAFLYVALENFVHAVVWAVVWVWGWWG